MINKAKQIYTTDDIGRKTPVTICQKSFRSDSEREDYFMELTYLADKLLEKDSSNQDYREFSRAVTNMKERYEKNKAKYNSTMLFVSELAVSMDCLLAIIKEMNSRGGRL